MRGYVINLDRQPERLTHFYQQPGSEIFQKVSAVDRKVLDIIGNKEFFFDVTTFTQMIPRDQRWAKLLALFHTLNVGN